MSPVLVQSNLWADCTRCSTSILSQNTIRTLAPNLCAFICSLPFGPPRPSGLSLA